jgi:hypothetical protein
MIGKGKAVSYTFNSLNYAQTKENAKEIDRQLLAGETPNELTNEFLIFQKLNNRADKKMFSFVLSPTDEDSSKMTKREWKEITREFLKKMELKDRQYIAYKHNDNGHNHLHIYVNRINEKGEAASDKFISNRASRVAEQIARERNMKLAADVRREQQRKTENKYRHVYEAHQKVKKDCHSLSGYIERMTKHGYKPYFKFSNADDVVGVKFDVNGELVKGSAIHRSMSGRKIGEALYNDIKSEQIRQKENINFKEGRTEKDSGSAFVPGPSVKPLMGSNKGPAKDAEEEEKREQRKHKGLEQ